ncbi:hypothetical protein GCM10009664_51900 [Kitasatospora gansuensis]
MSFEELLRASKLGLRRRRRALWVCAIALPADGALLLPLGNYPVAAAGLATGALLLYWLTLGTRRAVRRSLSKATGTIQVELTDEAVTIRRPGVYTEIAWQQYHKVVDTPEFLLLYVNQVTLTAVLKRGLDGAQNAELAAFVTAIPKS